MRGLGLWRVVLVLAGVVAAAWIMGAAARTGVALPATVRIPSVRPHPAGAPAERALFSHLSHDRLGCYSCHPGVFPQAPKAFTHADMARGQFCGACHDGRRATAVTGYRCGECHVAE